MARVRISTTVDESTLRTARERLGARDSELFDQALRALLDDLDTRAELAAFELAPYELDPDLEMPEAAADPELGYDGDVPADVIELARRRRSTR